MRTQFFNGAINGVTFRYRIEIERDAVGKKPNRMFPGIKFHQPITDPRPRGSEFVPRREAVLFPEKTPKLDHRPHCWIKRAPGLTSHIKSVQDHRRQLVRHRNRFALGSGIDPRQLAVQSVKAEDGVNAANFIEGRIDRGVRLLV